ncbi:MAG: anti-sigma factor, partial [Burkholderiales bacterium]
FAGVALLTWVLAAALLRPGEEERLAQDVLASHVRSTLGNHLIDVASSDQHTVKPWLSGKLNFSPPVMDLSGQGFELAGGRLDYVAERPVAVLVYKRRQHVVDVFVWPAAGDSARRSASQRGFNLVHFARGGMNYWAVSDLDANELADFAQLLAVGSGAP